MLSRQEAEEIVLKERPGLRIDAENFPHLDYLLSLYRVGLPDRHNLDLRELTADDLRHHIANL